MVRRIFSLTLERYGPYQIACKLSTDRIEIPVVHLARFNEGVNRSKPVKDPYGWGSSTIVNILKKREYLGHTINFKTRKHFKDKKSTMFLRTNGRSLRIPMKPLSTSRPLIWRRKSAAMYGVIQTAGAKRLPHRLALLCRLRRQDVCPPHQQWKAGFSIYLFQLYQSSVWDTMLYTTPYQ